MEDASSAIAGVPLFDFDIPAQPLIAALNQFADVSGRSALFPGTLVDGRRSAAVRGRHTAGGALRRLLRGSGLQMEEISSGRVAALVLKPDDAGALAEGPAAPVPASLGGYEQLVQAQVWSALCADRATLAGGYRSLLRFSIDDAGRVRQARLLGSTGSQRQDAALLGALRRMRLDTAPPADMRQPVTLLILPEQQGVPDCAGAPQP